MRAPRSSRRASVSGRHPQHEPEPDDTLVADHAAADGETVDVFQYDNRAAPRRVLARRGAWDATSEFICGRGRQLLGHLVALAGHICSPRSKPFDTFLGVRERRGSIHATSGAGGAPMSDACLPTA